MAMRRVSDSAPLRHGPEAPIAELYGPRVAGLAACIALLELEARALGHPLAAMLLAAAGEELRERRVDPGISAAGCPPPG